MKQAKNKQSNETIATTAALLIDTRINWALSRVDATLSATHVLKNFMQDNPDELELARDGLQGLIFLMLDTLTELETLRDDARELLQGDAE